MTSSLPLLLALPQEITTSVRTIGDYLVAGGPVLVPIVVCSVLAMALFMERHFKLRLGRVCPPQVGDALDLVVAGKVDEAKALLEEKPSAGGRILRAGIRRQGFQIQDVERAMEDQAHKEAEGMRANIRHLNLIANVAPLMGLLGTVIGIAKAFAAVVEQGLGKPEYLAGGIEAALITTIAGLTVAIPTLVAASWLQTRLRRLLLQADAVVAPAVEHLAARPEEDRDAA